MYGTPHTTSLVRLGTICCLLAVSTGCQLCQPQAPMPLLEPAVASPPRELNKAILPEYTIEPPDVLQIDAIHIVPKSPYRLKMLDSLVIQAAGARPDAPIAGVFTIEPGGLINFGLPYGRIKVAGMTVDEATTVIDEHLKEYLRDPQVSVALGETAGQQQILGQHLVGPDGTVTLGGYGSVSVVGKTVPQAKAVIEEHLSQFLEDPEVSVDVFAYTSKVYYVITQGAGLGDGVARFPITGNETVLDAITEINGLTSVSSKKIWIARPGRTADGHDQLLPVDWIAMTQRGAVETNYQIMPGDRVYVAEDKLVAMDTWIGKVISPAERIAAFVALNVSTVRDIRFFRQTGLRGGGGF